MASIKLLRLHCPSLNCEIHPHSITFPPLWVSMNLAMAMVELNAVATSRLIICASFDRQLYASKYMFTWRIFLSTVTQLCLGKCLTIVTGMMMIPDCSVKWHEWNIPSLILRPLPLPVIKYGGGGKPERSHHSPLRQLERRSTHNIGAKQRISRPFIVIYVQ